MEQQERLQRIAAQAVTAEDATATLRQLVAEAAGQPDANITAIATAAGVGRPTVYRWAAEQRGGPPYGDPVVAMDEALLALGEAGAGPVHELHKGLALDGERQADRQAKARRVLLGAQNLPGSASAMGLADEQRSIINAGVAAAHVTLRGGSPARPDHHVHTPPKGS